MCTNMRWVRNPYTHKSIFVSCGHCPACQQEKANRRTSRIKNNSRKGYINLFVTLTYKNDFVPYILRSDVERHLSTLPIYRQNYIRKVRRNASYDLRYKVISEVTKLDEVYIPSEVYDSFDTSFLSDCQKFSGAIGVIYYKDIQNFYKRLRINLQRKYNYNGKFSFFQCAEYGSHTMRPHFHAVISVPFKDIEIFKQAIVSSWPFDSEVRRWRGIEVAKNVASYVSSYVNKSASFPAFLSQNCFRQRHSYSQGYGMGNLDFSLDKIQEKVRRRDMSYNVLSSRDGVPEVVSLPIPEYVINRYFPKFKGYSRITRNQILQLIQYPLQRNGIFYEMNCSDEDAQKITTSLANSFFRYKLQTNYGINERDYIFRYACDFIDTWQAYENYKLRCFYENRDSLPVTDMYDNVSFVACGLLKAPTLLPFIDFDSYDKDINFYDPNKISSRVNKTGSLEELFFKKQKTRHITNLIQCKISDSF